jgi:tetratricopeptide (TPR) repeat protein
MLDRVIVVCDAKSEPMPGHGVSHKDRCKSGEHSKLLREIEQALTDAGEAEFVIQLGCFAYNVIVGVETDQLTAKAATLRIGALEGGALARFGLCAWLALDGVLQAERRIVRITVPAEATAEMLACVVAGIAVALRGGDRRAVRYWESVRTAATDPIGAGYLLWWLGTGWLNIAQNSGITNDFEQARSLLARALPKMLSQNDTLAAAQIYRALAQSFCQSPSPKPYEMCLKALECLREAETILNKTAYPIEWANALYDRAAVRLYQPRGKDKDALDLARDDIQAALDCFDFHHLVFESAQCKNALGRILMASPHPTPEILCQALGYFSDALRVRTKERHPWHYAQTKHNTGVLLTRLAQPGENAILYEAVACFKEALAIFDRDHHARRFYQTVGGLGRAYAALASTHSEESVHARRCYDEILNDYCSTHMPYLYGRTLYDLGNLLAFGAASTSEIASAADNYRHALVILTREAFPIDRALVLVALAATPLRISTVSLIEAAQQVFGYCNEALELLEGSRFHYEMGCASACIGSVLLAISDLTPYSTTAAITHYERAKECFFMAGCDEERDMMTTYCSELLSKAKRQSASVPAGE